MGQPPQSFEVGETALSALDMSAGRPTLNQDAVTSFVNLACAAAQQVRDRNPKKIICTD